MRYVGTVVVVGSCIEPVLKCGFLRKERDFQHGGVLGDAAMPSFRISYLPESLPSLVIKKNHFLRDTHTYTPTGSSTSYSESPQRKNMEWYIGYRLMQCFCFVFFVLCF